MSCIKIDITLSLVYLGLDATKPVFGASDKAKLKSVYSATETRQKIEISPVASLDMILSKKANNKGADQSARMC